MLTSLLSVYIASNLNQGMVDPLSFQEKTIPRQENLVSEASSNFTNLLNNSKKPIKNPTQISPIINAYSSIAIDRNSGSTLYEKNPHNRVSIASITKLMTALIILEENELDEIVSVSNRANNTQGSTMHLRTKEEMTVENLLKGLIINSANDAAVALAEHNSGTVNDFVVKMNQRATELGLTNTNFANPTGLDHPKNYSSAYDVAQLGNFIYNNPLIQEISQQQTNKVLSQDGSFTHDLKTTNELIGNYPGIKGLKTGRTDSAGLCLISVAENDQEQEIITVVLNSPARFQETKALSDWIFRSYNW